MSKEPKKDKDHSQGKPNNDGRENHKRHVEGSIGVHGQIEIHDPPELKGEKDSRYKQENSDRKKNRIVAVSTLVAVSIYTLVVFWQGCLTRKSIDNNSYQFQIEQRPYLWQNEVRPTTSIKVGEKMWATIMIINYGKSPALRTRITGKIFIGDSARKNADEWFAAFGNTPFPDREDSEGVIPPGIPTPATPPDKAPDYRTGEPYKERQMFGGGSIFTIKSDDPLKQPDVDGIFRADYFGVLVMRWQYYDAFGNFYWTNVCMATIPNGNVIDCPHHNEIH